MGLKIGKRYKTKGGWIAFISTFINGRPQGWCKDEDGRESPSMGTWDNDTGKCLKRGELTNSEATTPYDIAEF